MDIVIYRRHAKDCAQQQDRYAPRCGCPLWFQFNWQKPSTMFGGNKLRNGQNKWSAGTRIWSEAQQNAQKLEKGLEGLLEGKPQTSGVTVEDATSAWLEFRDKRKKDNTKAKLMKSKLLAWCETNSILMLSAFTTEAAIRFQMSLPFRTGDSNSLSVHWSVIGSFFNWAEGMGYIGKSPIPDPRQKPQFKIVVKKREVVPPTKKQIENVLASATGHAKLLCQLMRETGMALVDAIKFGMSALDAQKFGMSKPERLPVLEDGMRIRGNRTKTNERYRVRISLALKQQLEALGSPAFPGTYPKWREEMYKVFRKAGVEMTPHGFRHFRISEWLAQGISPTDVSKMVGTSEKEIRKTYEHWIKEAEDRLDEIQRQSWIKMGLDENGNAREAVQ